MTACAHVRSQASSLIGSVRLQGDPLACSKVDKHACLSPGRLAGFRNPKSTIDTRRFAQGGLVQWTSQSREQTMLDSSSGRSEPSGSVKCVLVRSRLPLGIPQSCAAEAKRRMRTDACTVYYCMYARLLPQAAGPHWRPPLPC